MRFWDASALVPPLVEESSTDRLLALLDDDPAMVVWLRSPVECTSAVARRERDGALGAADASAAIERLRLLSRAWNEVQPIEPIRQTTRRLLRVHRLRTADRLQLAAAILASEHDPSSLGFVSLDERLNDATGREGLAIHSL